MSIAQIRQAFASHPDIRLAYVFGSVARGHARPDSDVDIAVLARKPLDTATRMRLIEDLALATDRPVDLIDLHDAGEPLLGQILKHGKRLVGSDADHAEQLARHVYAMEDFVPGVTRMLDERRRPWIG